MLIIEVHAIGDEEELEVIPEEHRFHTVEELNNLIDWHQRDDQGLGRVVWIGE